VASVDIDSEGFAWIPEDAFLAHFAADIDPVKAKVMYAVQQPLHTSTFEDVMGTPAWKSLPSWYLVAKNDEVIPPDAERQFAERLLTEGALLTKASKEADIPAEPVLMKHPLILAGSADRDIELLNAAGIVRRCRSCTTGRSQQQTDDHQRSCCEARERSPAQDCGAPM
jgi:hypothetical protein